MDQAERDARLARLLSVLEPAVVDAAAAACALERAAWDVAAAASALLVPDERAGGTGSAGSAGSSRAGRLGGRDHGGAVAAGKGGKRKAEAGLDSWLGRRKREARSVDDSAPRSGGKPTGTGETVAAPPTSVEHVGASSPLRVKLGKAAVSGAPVDAGPDEPPPTAPARRPQKTFDLSQLRPPAPVAAPRALPALTVRTSAGLAAHGVPLALVASPLDPPLAAALYLAMMRESEGWETNKFWLAGRKVESGHTMASYARPEVADDDAVTSRGQAEGDGVSEGGAAGADKLLNGPGVRFYYSGNTHAVKPYPPLLARAAELVEDAVNAHLAGSPRFPLEYAGRWRANVCGSNRYDGAASSVGWHADQLTYLGPYPTIASLSLGTPRAFRVRQTAAVDAPASAAAPTRTFEVPLGHNSLCLMGGGCQERWKHTVPPQKALDLFRPAWDIDMRPVPPDEQRTYTSRINITFRLMNRFYREEPGIGPYGPREGTPTCRCGIPATLRADQKAKARARLRGPDSRTDDGAGEPDEAGTARAAGGDGTGDASDASPGGDARGAPAVVDDNMVFFWQCQSPGFTGELKGCGFFRLLDMRREGRGPCIGWS